jgi:KaiC/GvpD/RAD55 family RecA-like ATPase
LDGTEITLCPVCGEVSTGKGLLPVENATAQAVTQTLPRGELVLLCGALGDGTQIIVASFEYAGKPEQPTGVVKITLPEGALTVQPSADT